MKIVGGFSKHVLVVVYWCRKYMHYRITVVFVSQCLKKKKKKKNLLLKKFGQKQKFMKKQEMS